MEKVNMFDIPDHPTIRNLEQTGYPDRRRDEEPICPICGEATDTMYKNQDGEIVGCGECLKAVDAWEVA